MSDQNTRAPAVSSQAGERRASIARIIDPALFERFDRVAAQGRTATNGRRWEEVCYREAIDRTLAKADAILVLTPAPGRMGGGDLADEQLAKWHREWHWKDCERENIDHSIYPRDLRMLKAFIEHCNLRTAAQSADVRERTIEECALVADNIALPSYGANARFMAQGTIKIIASAIRSLAQAGGKR